MLVYREQQMVVGGVEAIAELGRSLESSGSSPEAWRDLLIFWGEFESAFVDAKFERRDGVSDETRALRAGARALAMEFVQRTLGAPRAADSDTLVNVRAHLQRLEVPSRLRLRPPEGYAQYGLYPEQYLRAALKLVSELTPDAAVVLGIRSIGTSLSSVVEGTLVHAGVDCVSYTVRPHGHPWDRSLNLNDNLERELRSASERWFVIVDEGPGLSGSSFISVVRTLLSLGVPKHRIVLVPSWHAAPESLQNAAARELWGEVRQFVDQFDPLWVPFDRSNSHVELSGGAWRKLFEWPHGAPAVQPQHERRKYLVHEQPGQAPTLLRFAGLSRHGAKVARRAELLAERGLCPEPLGISNGFLRLRFVNAQPTSAGAVSPELLTTIGSYVAEVRQRFPANTPCDIDTLKQVIEVNTREGLGDSALAPLTRLERFAASLPRDAVWLDGRMLPHEWLYDGRRYWKVDAWDHGDDHFFPGACDPAWDLAAAALELHLDRAARDQLLDRYAGAARDATIRERYPFYACAYAAFRVGYSTFASNALGNSEDGCAFAAMTRKYQAQLQATIDELATCIPV